MNRPVFYSVSPLTGLKILLAALCLVFGSASPLAAEAENNEIEIHQKNIAAIEKKEMAVIDDLHDIGYTLSTKKKKVAALKSAIQDIENKIDHNTSRSQALAGEIQEKKTYASRRIVALYKLYQLGKLNYLASADSMYQFFYRRTLLETVLDEDRKLLGALRDATHDLVRVSNDLARQKQELSLLQKDLTLQIDQTTAAKNKRTALLKKIRNEKSLELAAIASLKHSAQALDEKISRLHDDSVPFEKKEGPRPELFINVKGLLMMPVKGKIIHFYGTYTDTRFKLVNFRSGINIKADRGEPVHAVFKGTTLYASWFKGYGNMIIIDHGEHYYTVYAHAEELFKKKGEPVEAGEVIATVGDSGSIEGPGLHFEVRYHGKPVDPMQWIRKS
ncbi:MAG: peptidoglycan DD-metalloendopeptidase family protein [Thermodesulfobacteriota bacterium]